MSKSEDLIDLLKPHKSHVTTARAWDKYAKENNLPPSITIIKKFDTWNSFKEILNVKKSEQKEYLGYKKEEVEEILRVHGKNLENRFQWDEYAKEHKLPTYKTLKKHFTWEEILSYAGKTLIDIANQHYEVFSTASIKKWDEYAREHDLPSASSFIRKYETWKKAKVKVLASRNQKT
ncbi:hypothetical protein [Bacillus alkalicellulosilyticus]|uniref:hypothetical protein n=1 Tax=Alkalihalobacterium alkalicellulosilyticum TaxID=1912214 RepID=UPI000998D240|nr:hypothetical protein [Bacillus alkalicellulosilyticus]